VKRLALLLVAVALTSFLGRALYRALASDETKIRWMVADMVRGYDEGDVGDCIGAFAESWRHEGSEITRELLRGALIQTALERDPATKRQSSRVEIQAESLVVTVAGDKARLECEARFSRLRHGEWEPTWDLHAEAELEKGEHGWRIVQSRHRDLRGTELGR
jgi:hypothetical protein